nr:hypothetical protein [Thermococcus sp.]
MPFEIVFDGAKDFAKLINTASNLIDKAALKVTEEGISIRGMRAMSPNRAVLVELKLPREIFRKHEVYEEETIGISMDYFKKILKRGRSKDTLILKKGEENFLEVILEGTAKRTFKVPLIEAEESELKVLTVKVVVTHDESGKGNSRS